MQIFFCIFRSLWYLPALSLTPLIVSRENCRTIWHKTITSVMDSRGQIFSITWPLFRDESAVKNKWEWYWWDRLEMYVATRRKEEQNVVISSSELDLNLTVSIMNFMQKPPGFKLHCTTTVLLNIDKSTGPQGVQWHKNRSYVKITNLHVSKPKVYPHD